MPLRRDSTTSSANDFDTLLLALLELWGSATPSELLSVESQQQPAPPTLTPSEQQLQELRQELREEKRRLRAETKRDVEAAAAAAEKEGEHWDKVASEAHLSWNRRKRRAQRAAVEAQEKALRWWKEWRKFVDACAADEPQRLLFCQLGLSQGALMAAFSLGLTILILLFSFW